jgi:histone H3/H4
MSDDFTRHIFRTILCRVAQEKGFGTISETALEILTDCTIERLSEMSRSAASITTHCGRTDTNGLDLFCALARFSETPETLATYLNKGDPFPPFEVLVEPYPLPRLPRFYAQNPMAHAAQVQGAPQVFPFRANSTFQIIGQPGRGRTNHIPPFFPAPPKEWTYDRPPKADTSVEDDPELLRKRESDQERIKKALTTILAGHGPETQHAVRFDCELANLIANDLISMPTDLLESPVYQLEGVRGRVDPEFLPLTEVNDEICGEGGRDFGGMLSILSIKQGSSEPGTLKNASYNPTGSIMGSDKSMERASSPNSS